ncbi:MAG: hypothetical protein JWM76_3728 [Pseudonocardiales bacterium]|nr:hypothetical protein [Pseudonocardiales bacterium]
MGNLQRSIDGVAPDAPIETFFGMGEAVFWMRRMAMETAVHRWDAELSQGAPGSLEPGLATDGVYEVFETMVPGQVKAAGFQGLPSSVRLKFLDSPSRSFVVDGSPDPVATIEGPAEAIFLLLWKRIGLEDARLSVSGSLVATDELLATALVP